MGNPSPGDLGPRHAKPAALSALLALVSLGLAGCVDAPDPHYASFPEAFAASEVEHLPEEAGSTLRLKLLVPDASTTQPQGTAEIVILLYRGDPPAPLKGAKVTMDAWMPAMDHGTSPETDPAETDHGLYEGSTTFFMGGAWELQLTMDIGGETVRFNVPVDVATDDDTAHGGGPMNGSHGKQRPE